MTRLRSWSSGAVLSGLLSLLALLWVLIVISPYTYRPLMVLVGVWATFRVKPLPGRLGGVADLLWVVAALFGLGWPLAQGEAFWTRSTAPLPADLLAGVVALVVIAEAVRRTTGWVLPIVSGVFVAYAMAGPALVSAGLGAIAHRGYDIQRLVGTLVMTLDGIYGVPVDVAVTYIALFSLYGAVLEASGAGRFFLEWSLARTGGGTSPQAVGRSISLAGFLLGTVSGSGVATTVTLGSMAWPMLKRAGFAANTAGAMLAASGIGALLSPPTLGAAAFLIAEYLQISYLQVLVMATVPTVLYYLSIVIMIEGDADRRIDRSTDRKIDRSKDRQIERSAHRESRKSVSGAGGGDRTHTSLAGLGILGMPPIAEGEGNDISAMPACRRHHERPGWVGCRTIRTQPHGSQPQPALRCNHRMPVCCTTTTSTGPPTKTRLAASCAEIEISCSASDFASWAEENAGSRPPVCCRIG